MTQEDRWKIEHKIAVGTWRGVKRHIELMESSLNAEINGDIQVNILLRMCIDETQRVSNVMCDSLGKIWWK